MIKFQSKSRNLFLLKLSALIFVSFVSVVVARSGGNEFLLRNGDKPIVFLGDSITEQHRYTTYIETFVLTRFPSWDVRFRNVGWGGDTAWLRRRGLKFEEALKRDVLSLKPAVVLIDFGMNDARKGDRHLPPYIKYQKLLVEKIRACGARVILISPSPEERFQKGQPAGSRYNHMLWKYTVALKKIAEEYKVPFIDQFTPFVKVIEDGRKAGIKNFRLIPDSVHPNWAGHLVMAWAILKGMHAPSLVSELVIDVSEKRAIVERNCKANNLEINNGNISFVRLDKALPWPIPKEARWVLDVPGFDPVKDLSQYVLVVRGLSKGEKYQLKIDNVIVGTYKGSQLDNGINLTLVENPISLQVMELHNLVIKKNYEFFRRWRKVQLYPFPDWLKKAIPECEKIKQRELQSRDRTIKEMEKRINQLRNPKPHKFELIAIKK